LRKAEANAFQTRLQAQRYVRLIEDNAISAQDYDNARAAARQTARPPDRQTARPPTMLPPCHADAEVDRNQANALGCLMSATCTLGRTRDAASCGEANPQKQQLVNCYR
jgi:membrane fusion protein (multidrug efflux system)